MYSSLDAAWNSLHDKQREHILSSDLKEEIRTSWRHFRPAPNDGLESDGFSGNPSSSVGDASSEPGNCADVSVETQDDPQQTLCDPLFESVVDGFRMPTISSSPPSITSSKFVVVGDAAPSVKGEQMDLDWWNYFEDVDPGPKSDVAAVEADNIPPSSCHSNGIGSPSSATNTPFWKVTKSASLPNNDW